MLCCVVLCCAVLCCVVLYVLCVQCCVVFLQSTTAFASSSGAQRWSAARHGRSQALVKTWCRFRDSALVAAVNVLLQGHASMLFPGKMSVVHRLFGRVPIRASLAIEPSRHSWRSIVITLQELVQPGEKRRHGSNCVLARSSNQACAEVEPS